MRKLAYDCYYKNAKMKRVTTLEEAKIWKAEDKKNWVKEVLIECKKEEDEKVRDKRVEKARERREAIVAKAKERSKAVFA